MFKNAIAIALMFGLAAARCPNDCNGKGSCSAGSVCECHSNFAGNDCGKRLCYEGLAFIDTPFGDINANGEIDTHLQTRYQYASAPINEQYPGDYALARQKNSEEWNEAHFYAPCSNRGKCDFATGQCVCFPGFEGEGCSRTSCPNNCGEHGQCVLIDVDADVNGASYDSWDMQKTQKCVCDPGYEGPNCNLKKCVEGVDPIENLYTNTDSVWKIEWKENTLSGAEVTTGNVHFAISYSDDFGDVWTTSAMTILYTTASSGKSTPTYRTSTASVSDLNAQTYEEGYLAEQINASLKALPEDKVRNPYVWTVQHDGIKLLHAYPYPDNSITQFANAQLEAKAATVNAGKDTAKGKSTYVNDHKYRMPMWTTNTGTGTVATAFNCAANSVCAFVKFNEPVGTKKLTVNYKYKSLTLAGNVQAEISGTDSPSNKIVTVTEVGSLRAWSTTLDGSPTIKYDSTTKLHVCSKRGLCDYSTGTCKCFEGYSGHNCGMRNSLGIA